MLDKEEFVVSLLDEYHDELRKIFNDCHLNEMTRLDVSALNKKLRMINELACDYLLTKNDWIEIAFEICPEVYEKLHFNIQDAA